jgi:subtilisin family serine protease
MEAIEEFKKDPNVEYAEPNYIFSIVDDNPVSRVLTEEEAGRRSNSVVAKEQSVVVPNDPLYSQQWYIPAVQVDAVWDSTQGDTTQIIAFLDTGVDWHHPDLVDNIWTNQAEANGAQGADDDGDGLMDDVHGWDFINNDNDPMDDNSHGTHVAGIACAVGDNNIGIAGVNWHAKIMPVKVFQSSGRGDAATITQGIIYAAYHGATVINMSFGSYARSLTMEAALANAYTSSVLVAAAGNDELCIGPGSCDDRRIGQPFFPGALSYVLGVQAGDAMGPLGFSNYDPDGPIFSAYPDLLNYELKAPGSGIMSTVPNGAYRVYNGTSMAAPIVSGAVALYREFHPGESQELMWGNLINTTTSELNLLSALDVHANPVLQFVTHTIVDTMGTDNRNGLVDAGETIQLWFTVRNTWSQSDSVFVGLRLGEFEDTSVAHMLNSTAFVGSISPYAQRTNESNPVVIQIAPNVAHGRDIVFESLCWSTGSSDTVKQSTLLSVVNATEVGGLLTGNKVWNNTSQYLVVQNLRISEGDTLTIKPGVQVLLTPGTSIDVRGVLQALGTPSDRITITSSSSLGGTQEIMNNNGQGLVILKYANLRNLLIGFKLRSNLWMEDCEVSGTYGGGYDYSALGNYVARTNFLGNQLWCGMTGVWLNNNFNDNSCYMYGFMWDGTDLKSNSFLHNIISGSTDGGNLYINSTASYVKMDSNYWGMTDSVKIRRTIHDFLYDARLAVALYSPYLVTPSENNHAIVWKILIDGKNPQEEHIDPIGIGSHRFDVYFNRPMDTTFTPHLSFGVRAPYTQQSVTDSGGWSEDHRIWTAYKNIKLYTGDGINTLSVFGGKDLDGFQTVNENARFQFLIDAAGSASTEFAATPGLGKIDLEWNNAGLTDLLGFNMYRFTNVTDTTYSDTVLINTKLITDTLYTDFDVIPGKNYYYLYKVVRTDFSESDYSKVVGTMALTSSAGDANGDLSVNVLDIISIVSYILNQNPEPFIFAAADVNHDAAVNILDIVGTINLILHPAGSKANAMAATGARGQQEEQGVIRLDKGEIRLETDSPVAGLELRLAGCQDEDVVTQLKGLEGFEVMKGKLKGDTVVIVAYSLKGKMLGTGTSSLLRVNSGSAKITSVILANIEGKVMGVKVYNNGESLIPERYTLMQNYPNPFNPTTTIRYGVPSDVKVAEVGIYDILGRKVRTLRQENLKAGYYQMVWDGKTEGRIPVASGVYFYRLTVTTGSRSLYMQTKKMIMLR